MQTAREINLLQLACAALAIGYTSAASAQAAPASPVLPASPASARVPKRTPNEGAQVGPRTQKASGYSSYERESIKIAVEQTGHERELTPEGKTVEGIDVVRLDVIEPRDPVPNFLNILHTTSKDFVVRREVLLHEGEPFQETLADETSRNLRKFSQLSLVICVATKGSKPDTVRLLVITKDTWSLRLSYDLQANKNGIDSFVLQPQETNLSGLQHTAYGRFVLVPKAFSFGGGYKIPRLGKSTLAVAAAFDVFTNRDSGHVEGSQASIAVTQPLYTTRTEWAWSAGVGYTNVIARRYSDAAVFLFGPDSLPADKKIPFQYRQRTTAASVGVIRSFGWERKVDVTVGYAFDLKDFQTLDLSKYDPALVAAFVGSKVPHSDTRSAPYVQVHAYTNNYHRITDFNTLGLQEDYRLGYDAYLQVYPVTQSLGSTRTFLGVYGSAQYTVALGDGMARASVESVTEAQADVLSDASFSINARAVTPRFGIGRLVFDAALTSRYRNYLQSISVLGGEGRLRGYPTSFFDGENVVVMNLEYRSTPISVFRQQVGAVVFYDTGDTPNNLNKLNPKQSVGVGIRVLLPQLNRTVFRADIGFPLVRPLPSHVSPYGFFVGFEQAFPFGSAGP